MYVSNGNGFAVPAFTKRMSTNATKLRRSSGKQDECRDFSKVEDTAKVHDVGEHDDVVALRGVVHGS